MQKSKLLLDILAEHDRHARPATEQSTMVDNRKLTATIPGDGIEVLFHLAGPNGGRGQKLHVPLDFLRGLLAEFDNGEQPHHVFKD